MKKFFAEFKKFITRGNVVDMAVGVVVGGAFTAIVNGLSNFILKPITNWLLAKILGKGSLEELYTYLKKVVKPGTTEVDLANSIYIDWGAFINTVINFFLVALVLFTIVKIINRVRENHKEFTSAVVNRHPTRAERKEMRKAGISRFDKKAVSAFLEQKAAEEAEAARLEKEAQEEAARKEALENPTTEMLLKQIRDLLAAKESQK